MERKRSAEPTKVQDPNIWAEDIHVIQSMLRQMIAAGTAYVKVEKDNTGKILTQKIYRTKDDFLMGFIDEQGIENWFDREAEK